MLSRHEVPHASQELVAGTLLLVHQVENPPGGSVGLRAILPDIVQSAPDVERSAHDIDVVR
ncbi:hypothetical protein LCM4579_10340 [Ensifer sp. LCM 4579]|nr:hypothetical protein LCM4579_10340 [Ensifer sp. LCM 4579]